jgi:hypothetical protein
MALTLCADSPNGVESPESVWLTHVQCTVHISSCLPTTDVDRTLIRSLKGWERVLAVWPPPAQTDVYITSSGRPTLLYFFPHVCVYMRECSVYWCFSCLVKHREAAVCFKRRKIRFIAGSPKCMHLKKLTCKEFMDWR